MPSDICWHSTIQWCEDPQTVYCHHYCKIDCRSHHHDRKLLFNYAVGELSDESGISTGGSPMELAACSCAEYSHSIYSEVERYASNGLKVRLNRNGDRVSVVST